MVGESFEIYASQMSRIALSFPPWLEKILKFTPLKCLELSTMIGEIFEIYTSQMARIALNLLPWLEKILKFTPLKCLEFS